MICKSNFSIHKDLPEHSQTLYDLPWLPPQLRQLWLWPPSLVQLHWPPGYDPNTQATSLPSPCPVHNGCLSPPHSLQGSVKSNLRSLPHPSLCVSSSCLIFSMGLPLTGYRFATACLSPPHVERKFQESSNTVIFPAAFSALRPVPTHSMCSRTEWMNCRTQLSSNERQGRSFTNWDVPIKAFTMQGGVSVSLLYNVLVP